MHPVAPTDVSPLIEPAALADLMRDPAVIVLDCGRKEAYERAHIPGAVLLPHDYWLKQTRRDGKPRGEALLCVADLEALFGGVGIQADRHVVTYDDNGGRAATRVWWVLKYLGHDSVSVLNGGWHAWLDDQGDVAYERPNVNPVSFVAQVDDSRLATLAAVRAALASDADVQLVDARSAEEWSGSDLHGNKRGGRIPGAKHLEWADLICRDRPWRFRSEEEIRRRAAEAGVDPDYPVITYCQGGVRAAHVAFALELIGKRSAAVYDASMEQWGNRADTPMETA